MACEVRICGLRGISRLLALALLGLSVACATDGVQTDAPDWEPDRTAWGTPVIDGTWDFRSLVPLLRPPEFGDKLFLTREEADAYVQMKLDLLDQDKVPEWAESNLDGAYNNFWMDHGTDMGDELRTSLIVDPPNGRLPDYTPAALAEIEQQRRGRIPPVRESSSPSDIAPPGPEWLGISDRCLIGMSTGPPILPGGYNNNVRIVQARDYVLLVIEMIHDVRIIPMDGRPFLPPGLNQWLGDSRAHWEGNTLVVETIRFTDKTPTLKLPGAITSYELYGSVGSAKNMHLIEKFTPVAEGRLLYEFTIDDPQTFVRPFTVQLPMRESDGPMYEYACHEGNYALKNTLKGIRFQESQGK